MSVAKRPEQKGLTRPEPKKAAIAARLRLARQQAGLSQGQVAKLLGLHRPSVSEMEAGRRNVTIEEMSRLAQMYGVGMSWLACEDTEEPNLEKDRIELVARELAKLKPKDVERILDLLKALRSAGGGKK